MEDENTCSSTLHSSDSVLQPLQQESCTSTDHQHINGEQEAIVLDRTEVEIKRAYRTDELNLSSNKGQDTPEETEPWEQMMWSVRPMSCAGAPLSFATVQWDMPGPFTEEPSLMTDRSLANELDSGVMTNVNGSSPSPHQSEEDNAELLIKEEKGEQDEFASLLLNSDLEWTGNNSEPCDAVDLQEPVTQEQEDSAHELVYGNNDIPRMTDSLEKEEYSVTLAPVETVDLIDTLEENEGSEDEVDGLEDLKHEEEQQDPGFLLTGPEDSEDQEASSNGVETEEEEEEQSVTHLLNAANGEEAKTVSCVNNVEVSVEPLQTDDTVLNLNPDKLQQSEVVEESGHSGSEEDIEILEPLAEGQTQETGMCQHVDHHLEPGQQEAVDNNEELSIQAANAERVTSSEETLELAEKLEEKRKDCDQTISEEREAFPQLEQSKCEQLEMTKDPELIQAEIPHQIEEEHLENSDELQQLEESPEMDLTKQSSAEQAICVEDTQQQSEQPRLTTDLPQPSLCEQLVQPENSDESEISEQLCAEGEVTQQTAEAEGKQVDSQAETLHQAEEARAPEDGDKQTVTANGGQQHKLPVTAIPHMNGGEVDKEMASRLAERLFKLDGIPRVDVVKHLDKDNDFSHVVGEEYLKFFDFTGQTLDQALRSFLKVVVLIGESQERERVLQHFACRFHQCNPDSFSSTGAVLALTCALMLLNTDLHGQHVGKSMSSSKFVSNLDGMNECENFSKDLLKSLYNSIKSEPLEWAVDEEELKSSVLLEEDAGDEAPLHLKANPFQDVPHDKKASVVKEGFLQRKLHADIDGKRTPWGKRSWKTFYGVLRGMVLYLQKNEYRREQQTYEEVVSVHHSLAEPAAGYTKKPHVFRLQTADWRVFLFQASSKVEMKSWINRFNLVSALQSSPPFPAAVGSQRKFFRPILPASLSAHTLERQLQSHTGMLESFKADLLHLHENPPEGRKAKAKELEEHRIRFEYLQYEVSRYEIYIQVLEGWKTLEETDNNVLNNAELLQFDKAMCVGSVEEEEEGGLKKSYSSPSLEVELAPPTVIKVRRNISERRTYRRTLVPRIKNKEI
ncbi:PH and SEC7 domain-containing protein 4 isoform X1 [Solea solea]|uniref:PH and SEC7 domain-containing protein 4 isoform X1 n=1 Tax=Solea solea TaxID=90069 RepID=UPI00272D5D15|nr:PH and SEC7 domain-containing protein 4 isoform X1 [Solea solea]XP_058473217.1 PH and SEC7 domain-containing protein 4 isoform X1 [Solea solea]XP_058473218.1 PH and SEC7 domain-containing protein 4 isoform X1 [Solea solea]XP_058473219.1 PH and SEC7 domain-containing protein 4 isoform X1 [Solea solea]